MAVASGDRKILTHTIKQYFVPRRHSEVPSFVDFPFPYQPSAFSWSPDGKQLLFLAQWGESDLCPMGCPPLYGLRALELDAMRYRWVSFHEAPAAWSPDGTMLGYGWQSHVFVVPANGGAMARVLRGMEFVDWR